MGADEARMAWLEIILRERFGLDVRLRIAESGDWCIDLAGKAYKEIRVANIFSDFALGSSDLPCARWNSVSEGYLPAIEDLLPAPGVVELARPLIVVGNNIATVKYDILGLAWWMLSRAEEVGRRDLDQHCRFPAANSHAFRFGYLDRPVVDEWLHILAQVIQRLWPEVVLKKHQFKVALSHDVDRPARYSFRGFNRLLQGVAADIVKHREYRSAFLGPLIRMGSSRRLHPADPYNTFDWLMDVSKRNGVISSFYFICGRTDPIRDADYSPNHPAIRELMRRIYSRGHEIGLHPSYNTYLDPMQLVAESDLLRRICLEEKIAQSGFGGRMHYLRWQHPETLYAWEMAGMAYDCTLTYADHSGFRCGTCFEYPAFDPVAGRMLKLRIRPLIAMECTIVSAQYLGLGLGEQAFSMFYRLKEACRAVGGVFTLLWHNSELTGMDQRLLYLRIVEA